METYAHNPLAIHPFAYEGHCLTVIELRGEVWCLCTEVALVLGYKKSSKLAELIRANWSGEFILGHDYLKVTGEELAALKEALRLTPQQGVSSGDADPISVSGHTPNLLLLSRSGLDMALLKTRKEAGARLRRWLVDVVFPQLRHPEAETELGLKSIPGGRYVLPGRQELRAAKAERLDKSLHQRIRDRLTSAIRLSGLERDRVLRIALEGVREVMGEAQHRHYRAMVQPFLIGDDVPRARQEELHFNHLQTVIQDFSELTPEEQRAHAQLIRANKNARQAPKPVTVIDDQATDPR